MTPFQCYLDADGNIGVADGHVVQLKTGVVLPVGAGAVFAASESTRINPNWFPFPASWSGTLIGGSGRNLIVSGLAQALSGPPVPAGIYKPGRPGIFRLGAFNLTVTGSSAATISDGSNTVAILSSGGTAPVGNYVGTTYGRSTYNGGSSFTLAASKEVVPSPAFPMCQVLSAGGFSPVPAGNFTTSDAVAYALDSDGTWTITVNTDGSADLKHSGTIIAARAAGGSDCNPSGKYDATAAGMLLNLTTANPVGGEAYSVCVYCPSVLPSAGYAYLTIIETSGTLSAVYGPFFGTSLPANSGGVYHVPIAESDGLAFQQLHTGSLVWPDAGGGGIEAIHVTAAEYDALTAGDQMDPTKWWVIPTP